jgi:hypothetical protein
MWSDEQRGSVLRLTASGLADREVSRRTGVPRSTVGNWRRNPHRSKRFRRADPQWRPPDPVAYSYLLGLYLGDGHIVRRGMSSRIRITLDALHEGVNAEAASALGAVFPEARVARYRAAATRTVELALSDPALPYAFPQCGPGKKHERSIRLIDWQRDLTRTNPEALIRGLIHSDGCRSLNRFSTELPSGRVATYEYPRYFFSNLSADIREIFCDHCDLLGIRWTLSNPRNVSVAHRRSVALLDGFVGPKY